MAWLGWIIAGVLALVVYKFAQDQQKANTGLGSKPNKIVAG
jgi:hypothetical protein